MSLRDITPFADDDGTVKKKAVEKTVTKLKTEKEKLSEKLKKAEKDKKELSEKLEKAEKDKKELSEKLKAEKDERASPDESKTTKEGKEKSSKGKDSKNEDEFREVLDKIACLSEEERKKYFENARTILQLKEDNDEKESLAEKIMKIIKDLH